MDNDTTVHQPTGYHDSSLTPTTYTHKIQLEVFERLICEKLIYK